MNADEIVVGGRYLWDVFGRGWIVRIVRAAGEFFDGVEDATGLEIPSVTPAHIVRVLADQPPVRPRPLIRTRDVSKAEEREANRRYRAATAAPGVDEEYLVDTMYVAAVCREVVPPTNSYPTFALATVCRASPKGRMVDVIADGCIDPLKSRRMLTHMKRVHLYERAFRTPDEKRRAVGGL